MNYREDLLYTQEQRQAYLDGIEKLIDQRQQDAAKERAEYVKNIFTDPDKYRGDFRKMLGWPLVDHNEQEEREAPTPRSVKLADEDGYSIYRMTFEVLNGIEMTGLYFEMHGEGKKPLVLVQHGGSGTPEAVSGIYGIENNYNHMLERVIANGVHAFAPQLLLWKVERYGIPYDRKEIDARLKRVGSSITALEIYALMRILNYFEKQDNVLNFGMVGLSYGGFYTLFLSAIDTRIKAAFSCSFFNSRDCYPWSDWTWLRSAQTFDDAEIACLVYPRKLCIEIGERDNLFAVQSGKQSFERLRELCSDVGTDWVSFNTFDGVHEFALDDVSIKAVIEHLFADL